MRRILTIALCTTLAAVGPGVAVAAAGASSSPSAVIADCQAHSKLTGAYTISALQRALATLPSDVAEYTDCHDVIQTKLLSQSGAGGAKPGGSGGSGGSFLPTPVIVILVVLALAAATFGALAVRRRRDA